MDIVIMDKSCAVVISISRTVHREEYIATAKCGLRFVNLDI